MHPPTLFLLLLKKPHKQKAVYTLKILGSGFGIHIYRPEASLQVKCKSKVEKGY